MRRLSTGFSLITLGLATLLGGPVALRADLIVTTASTTGDADVFPVSSTDLFQTNLSSIAVTGDFSYFSAHAPSRLTDGAFGLSGVYGGDATVALEGGATMTFLLDVSVNTNGYTLTRLDSFASWDEGRDGQEYTVAYSTVSAPTTFVDLVTISQFNPVAFSNYSNSKVSLTDDSGPLATHVAAVRYTFTSFESDGTAYREIDAFGSVTAVTAAVPEPSSLMLAMLGAVGLLPAMRAARGRKAGRQTSESPKAA